MLIRPATEADCPGIIEIENREIAENFAHFGQTPTALEQCVSNFRARGKHPWYVAEEDGLIVGYAKAGPWRVRESYQFSCEVGVYIRPEWQGKRVGRLLYEQLIPAVRASGFRTIVAGIAQPNPASVRLHESFGMKYVGTLPDVGFKFGKWISVGYWVIHWDDEACNL